MKQPGARLINGFHFALGLVVGVLISACVSQQVISDRGVRTTLTTTRVGNREIIAWESEPGVYYTVVYATEGSSAGSWRPLPGCVRIQGTGEMIVITNFVRSDMERRYRLIVEPSAR